MPRGGARRDRVTGADNPQGRRDAGDDLLRRYLPPAFYERLPVGHGQWRGRTVLLLRALGYPLEMAWSLVMSADPEQSGELQALMADLDDARLVTQLEATAATRGDGSHLEFVSFGLIRNHAGAVAKD